MLLLHVLTSQMCLVFLLYVWDICVPQLPVHVHVSWAKRYSVAEVKTAHSRDLFWLSPSDLDTSGVVARVTDRMHTLHSSQIPGAAEEIQPMLFTESASTPTVSSTPFTLAPPRSCESKSCDFLLWNIWLLICPWVKSKLPHTLLSFDPWITLLKHTTMVDTRLWEEMA